MDNFSKIMLEIECINGISCPCGLSGKLVGLVWGHDSIMLHFTYVLGKGPSFFPFRHAKMHWKFRTSFSPKLRN